MPRAASSADIHPRLTGNVRDTASAAAECDACALIGTPRIRPPYSAGQSVPEPLAAKQWRK
jgi:hypothetical protein